MINEALSQLKNKLSGIEWAVFGGVAVAIHNGKLYRDFDDIDIIIENKEDQIKNNLKEYGLEIKLRNGRKRGYLIVNGTKIELLFLVNDKELDLADGKFKFQNIKKIKFNNLGIPVVDLQSLYCAKLRHKESLEKEAQKMEKKLKNCNNDIEIIQNILKNSK